MSKAPNRIFSLDNPKAVKAQKYGYLNAIHYMAPASLSGANLCPHASPGCIALCLGWTSGQAGMVSNDADLNEVRKSRIAKAQHFMRDRQDYLRHVVSAILSAKRKAEREGLALCVRLNGSTDIGWEGIRVGEYRNLMAMFPEVQFVDYTKSSARAIRSVNDPNWPSNYHLTFSRSEINEEWCIDVLSRGGTVAAVFETIPETWNGFPVINGDEHDLRHLDGRGVVVGLSPKGRKAKRDTSGFVVRN